MTRTAWLQQAQSTETEVSILCKHPVPFGCTLKLVGSHPALGAWDAAAAPGKAGSFTSLSPSPSHCCLRNFLTSAAALDWNEGHEWRGGLRLPTGEHEFKCVIVDSNGKPQEWEQGQNRLIPVSLQPL